MSPDPRHAPQPLQAGASFPAPCSPATLGALLLSSPSVSALSSDKRFAQQALNTRCSLPLPIGNGSDEQMFGAEQQVPHPEVVSAPALGEGRHRGFARRLVSMRSASDFAVVAARPPPGTVLWRDLAVLQHLVIVTDTGPFQRASRSRVRCGVVETVASAS